MRSTTKKVIICCVCILLISFAITFLWALHSTIGKIEGYSVIFENKLDEYRSSDSKAWMLFTDRCKALESVFPQVVSQYDVRAKYESYYTSGSLLFGILPQYSIDLIAKYNSFNTYKFEKERLLGMRPMKTNTNDQQVLFFKGSNKLIRYYYDESINEGMVYDFILVWYSDSDRTIEYCAAFLQPPNSDIPDSVLSLFQRLWQEDINNNISD